MKHLAIIGAGAAGLAAAWKLRREPIEITVFEKSRGLCGRAASKTMNGVRFDYGANYLKAETAEVEDLIRHQLPTEELVDIARDVWTFDLSGNKQPGDPEENAKPRWTYRSGISTLGKLLAAKCGNAEIKRETRIERMEHADGLWKLISTEDETFGPYDAVLMTAPAPQSVQILEDSEWGGPTQDLAKALSKAIYVTQFAFLFAYEEELTRPGDFYALLNVDRDHPVAWLSFENDKPDRVPEGQTAIMVQAHPGWSEHNFDRDEIELVPDLLTYVNQLLGWPTDLQPSWYHQHRWRFAHPHQPADAQVLATAEDYGLYFAGDSLAGKGRVHLALQSGLDVAKRIGAAI